MGTTPHAVITKEYGTTGNFMTPDWIGEGWITHGTTEPRIAYEISGGRGMSEQKIWGLSLVAIMDGKTARLTKYSDCHQSRGSVDRDIARFKSDDDLRPELVKFARGVLAGEISSVTGEART